MRNKVSPTNFIQVKIRFLGSNFAPRPQNVGTYPDHPGQFVIVSQNRALKLKVDRPALEFSGGLDWVNLAGAGVSRFISTKIPKIFLGLMGVNS